MRFAVALPWWGYLLAFGLAALLAWTAYARVPAALSRGQRGLLTTLRGLALIAIVAALLRPVAIAPSSDPTRRLVPILVDISRSMGVADEDGETRLARARAVADDLSRQLGTSYRTEILTFGDAVVRAGADELKATARRSDLTAAVEETLDRYRHDAVAGIVVLSDGGDTSGRSLDAGRASREQ